MPLKSYAILSIFADTFLVIMQLDISVNC